MKKKIPPYYCINWGINSKDMEFYDIMPYLVDCWKEEKKHKHKLWNISFEGDKIKGHDEKMPESFEDFKRFINYHAHYRFWARCEYEVIVSAWPPHPRKDENGNIKMFDYDVYYPEKRTIPTIDFYDHKLDIYQQIKANIDVITKHFMDYINK